MRRRDALRVGGATLVGWPLAVEGATAHAHPTPGGTDDATDASDGDPGSFEPLGRLTLAGAKELVADGEVAYVVTTDGFATVDLSEPAEPALLAERRGLFEDRADGPLREIYDGKRGGDHYALGGPGRPLSGALRAAVVYDVSDPSDPERVLTHETDFYHHNLDVDGGTLYLCGNDGDRNPLVCVDVESGEELGRWSLLDADGRWADVDHRLREIHDVWVEGGVAHVAYWNAGTWLVDVSDPTDPSPLVGLRGLDPEEQATVEGDEAVRRARFGLPGNDHFAMPAGRGTERPPGTAADLVVLNEEAWGHEPEAPPSDLGGVELWDVESEERLARIEAPPSEDATYGGVWTTPHNFDVAGEHLYTSWYRGGVKVHDVSDPAAPEELAHWRDTARTDFWTAQRAAGCVVAGSWRDHSREAPLTGAAVYTFPDPGDSEPTGTETADDGGAGVGLLAGALGVGAGAVAQRLRS